MAQKKLRFRVLAVADITAAVSTLMVAVPGAWLLKQGVWSLVWAYLVGASLGTTVLIVWGWRTYGWPLPRFRGADLAGYASFGLYRTGALILNFFNIRVAQTLVGVLLGAQTLGYYTVAASLVLRPAGALNPILLQVTFPVLSELQEDAARLRHWYFRTLHLMMLVAAPVALGIAAVAPVAVPLLLGERWGETVALVQALAFYALLRSPAIANSSLLNARGKASWGVYWNLILLLVVPPFAYLAILLGDEALYGALTLAAIQLPLSLVNYRVFTAKLIGPSFAQYLRAVCVPIILAIVMSVAVIGAGSTLGGLAAGLRLSIEVCVGVGSYLALSWLFQRGELLDLVNGLRGGAGARGDSSS